MSQPVASTAQRLQCSHQMPALWGQLLPRLAASSQGHSSEPGEGAWWGGRSDSTVTMMSWGHMSVWGSMITTPAAAPWPTLFPPAVSDCAQPGVEQGL